MNYRVLPWNGSEKPTSREVRELFELEGLSPTTWSNGPGDSYSAHQHSYQKILYCVEGEIVFHVEGEAVKLEPGDRLEIDPQTSHSADVGPKGVVCMEAAVG